MVPREPDPDQSDKRILGIIPARGGSKRIPRKNLLCLGGKPLIAYAIEAAKRSNFLGRTILSTEDPEIRSVALELGAEVPFVRPAELSSDASLTVDVVLHALGEIEPTEGREYDYVCVLEPTAPLRTTQDIDSALSMLLSADADSIIGLTPVDYTNPARLRVIRENRVYLFAPQVWRDGWQQQALEQVYKPAGGLFACRRDTIVHGGSLHGKTQCGYIFPPERGVDIDTFFDLAFAEFLISRRVVG